MVALRDEVRKQAGGADEGSAAGQDRALPAALRRAACALARRSVVNWLNTESRESFEAVRLDQVSWPQLSPRALVKPLRPQVIVVTKNVFVHGCILD
jgi:hypothetical protein